MDAREVYTEFIKRLLETSVFYLHSSHVDATFREMFDTPLDPYMNEIKYFSSKGSIKPLKTSRHLQNIFLKEKYSMILYFKLQI